MKLLFDIGNTNIKIAKYFNEELISFITIRSDKHKLLDEYRNILPNDLVEGIEDVVISSVVPNIQKAIEGYVVKYLKLKPLVLGKGVKTGLSIKTSESQVGSDLIAASLGALKYEQNALIVDMGTAIKVMHLKDGNLVGVSIAPGLTTSFKSLVNNAALLPDITIEKPKKVLCNETVECMNSGLIFGFASLVDGLIKKSKKEIRNDSIKIFITGGDFKFISSSMSESVIYKEFLIHEGLSELLNKNKKV